MAPGVGVGTFTVQIAKALGAEVTAVTRTTSAELIRSLGADHVIDHTRADFTKNGNRYDLILEVGPKLRFPECRSSLTAVGKLVLVGAGGGLGGPIGRFVAGSLRSRMLKEPVTAFVSWESTDDLLTLKDLIEAGKVTLVVDRTYALSETPEAVRSVESGGVRGKLVITV
jgi:NADPH:quinone reductase-like Zn-dependent oxidoreductase